MIITNLVKLSVGASKASSNVYLKMIPNVATIQQDGMVLCDLIFYYSEADADAGADPIYLLDENGQKIVRETIQFVPGEVIKSNLKDGSSVTMDDVFAYFKTKLKAVLEQKHNWQIDI